MAKRQTAPFGATIIEDPTIAQVAALEYERVCNRIGMKVSLGVWFYRAREIVLAEEIPDIAKAYGKVVASRVTYAIERTPPSNFPEFVPQAGQLVPKPRVSWYSKLAKWLGVA